MDVSQHWLVVSTHLKNISQIGNLRPIGVKIKFISNHHLEHLLRCPRIFWGVGKPTDHHRHEIHSTFLHFKEPFNLNIIPLLILLVEEIPAPAEVGSFSYYLQSFIHPRWCRISSINSMDDLQSWHPETDTFSHPNTQKKTNE